MSGITVLGLGAMGSAIAGALIENDHAVSVWNRSAGKADSLVARGAREAVTVADAIGANAVVVVCVLDYAAVRDALGDAATSLAGRTLVNLTNGTPEQARAMADWTRRHGAAYVDGGVMVTPDLLGTPDAVVLYSGDADAYLARKDVLDALGAGVWLGDDPATAALYDIALLSAMFGMFGGFLHAAALLRSEGLPVTAAAPMIESLLEAMIALLPQTAIEIDSAAYPEPMSNNRMMAGALKNILDGSTGQGLSPDLMQPIWELFQRGVEEGLGDHDIAALVQLIRA
jgi:3-hydroxyisobutyrate dehydrogenase-like beta-hydroxyacid dehydrogenase